MPEEIVRETRLSKSKTLVGPFRFTLNGASCRLATAGLSAIFLGRRGVAGQPEWSWLAHAGHARRRPGP